MGDKGGKKDKDKSQKQNDKKQKQKEQGKSDKQPKSKLSLQRNLLFDVYQVRLLSPVRKVRPMISLLSPPNKPNHHFNIKGSHRQDCS